MPMNSAAPRRSSTRSGGAVSRPSPLSTMKRSGWNDVSAVISLLIGREQLTDTPSRTSPAARTRWAGVMKLSVPSWSSAPQRPQLLRLSIIEMTSRSAGSGCAMHPPCWIVVAGSHHRLKWRVGCGRPRHAVRARLRRHVGGDEPARALAVAALHLSGYQRAALDGGRRAAGRLRPDRRRPAAVSRRVAAGLHAHDDLHRGGHRRGRHAVLREHAHAGARRAMTIATSYPVLAAILAALFLDEP